MRRLLRTLATATVAAFVVASAGCGGTHRARPARPSARFDVLHVAIDPGLDYLDPGLSYTADGWIPMFGVYLTLLGYDHSSGAAGTRLVPVLARSLPTISADGLRYRLRLRRGLRYSNGAAIRASDFAWAVRRLFLLNSPGEGFFVDIAGAKRFARMRTGRISGIHTDDATGDIEIRLVRRRADFANVLAALFAAPVPRTAPADDRSLHPIPASGPYRIASYRPGRGFTLVRNSFFHRVGNVVRGHPTRVEFEIIGDPAIALRRTLSGRIDWDMETIPPDRLGSVARGRRAHLRVAAAPDTFFFFLNTRTPPFDRLAVRRAVNFAIDRDALVRIAGGLGRPTENVLPPSYPQFRPLHLYRHDVRTARSLVNAAGARGARVDVWGPASPTVSHEVAYVAAALRAAGLDARPKLVAPAIYFTAVADQRTRAQIGWSNWSPDYPHPSDWFDALFDGRRISQVHNTNLSNANLPAVNHAIARLDAAADSDRETNAGWAALDRKVMEEALVAPFMNGLQTELFGPRIDMRCYAYHDALYTVLWTQLCAR